jgi:hypothetical protein
MFFFSRKTEEKFSRLFFHFPCLGFVSKLRQTSIAFKAFQSFRHKDTKEKTP